ncbi:MAG: DUF58 domain-containing protein [Clostridia bacterium]|nr:DUF58 domain-containing protein [Clostridia bacterium]
MEHMKQCPQCGKYVAADRTYCMNCGVTLGIRCPDCRAVMPVGAKTCTACGHSFVKKKKKLSLPLWDWMKKNAKPLTGGLCLLLLVFTLVAAAFPGVNLTLLLEEVPFIEHTASGYDLMGYFLGGHPEGLDNLLSPKEFKDDASLLKVLFFAEGLGWLTALIGLALAITLLAPNYKKLSRITARRLFLPLGVTLGGGALAFGLTPVVAGILSGGMAAYLEKAEDGYLLDTATSMPTVLFMAAAVLMMMHVLLYLVVFSKMDADEEAEELSLSHILVIPLKGLAKLIHRVTRKIRKKLGGKVSDRDEPVFTVTHRFSSYIVLFIVALVFTQALLSKVSNIFFWFVFLLPIVLLAYVLLAKHALSVSMISDSVTTEKNTPYTYEFRIDNHSPLALPFIDAQVSIPQSNAVRCTERTVRLSMAPMTHYHMKNTVSFRFRGTYDIGVKCFYIYDFFRLFRVRVDVESLTTVYVLPRRLTLDETSAHSVSDDTARTVRSPLVVDKLEVSDIRDYRNGDSLKSIHWKLSSKSETFIVKDYNTGTSNQTVVFCDMAPHFPDEPPKKKTATAGEGEPVDLKSLPRAERKAARKARKEKAKADANLRKKNRRIKEYKDTHAISDEALQARLDQRAAVAEKLNTQSRDPDAINAAVNAAAEAAPVEAVDVHELAKSVFYEDMNEYLADGVVELTIATVLAELRRGHEVLLLWFDRRSDTGVFAYSLRGADEFETIYHLFATAPLCAPDQKVTSLTAMISDIQSAKQMFVVSTMDAAMLTDLCGLPGVSDAGSFGSAEVVLYNPEERFRYPRDRAGYLEGCREQLAASGLSLTAGAFNVTQSEGGNIHEAK